MTTRQRKAIAALISEPTKKAAAAKAGISESTLRSYLADAEFQKEYNKAFSDLLISATRQAQASLSPAVKVLREIFEDDEQPSSARITAARSILEYGLRLTEQVDMLEQIKDLERWRDENIGQH